MPPWLVILWAAFGILLGAGAILRNETAYEEEKEKWRERLTVLAEDYAAVVADWIVERRQDATVVASYPTVRFLLEHGSEEPPPASGIGAEPHARELFDTLARARGFVAIWAIDEEGRTVASSTDAPPLDEPDLESARRSAAAGPPALLGVRTHGARLGFGFLAPVAATHGRTSGVVLLAVRPEERLYPRLTRQILETRTDEAFLVRREGDRVEFLSPLRLRPGSPAGFSVSAADRTLAEAEALTRRGGFGEYRDYRGMAVFAASRAIPETPWALVVKVDRNEALTGWYASRLWVWISLWAIFLSVTGAGAAWWRHTSARHYRALSDRDARYRSLLQQTQEAVAAEVQGRLVFASSALARMFGYAEEGALLGKPFHLLFAPEWRDAVTDFRAGLLEEGPGPETCEVVGLAADGSRFDVEIKAAAVRIDGELGLEATLRDITRRRRMENELRESEERYRILFERNPQPMWVYDLQTLGFLAVNEAACRHYGYTRDEFLRMTIRDIRPAEDMPEVLKDVDRARRGIDLVRTWRHRKKDGTPIDVEVTSHTLSFAGRSGRLGILNDVTERRRSEERIRKSEERFQLVARATNDAIWDRDLVTNALAWGDGFFTLFGYGREYAELGIDSWYQGLHPEDKDRVLAGIRAVIDGDGQNWVDDYRFCRADGTYAHILDRGYVIRDATGKPVRMIGAMMDVSEQKRLELQLLQSQKMEAVGRLAGGVAHDFNNLLTAISGYSDLLLGDLDPADPRREHAEEIRRAADRAAGLTQQLLAYSRRQMLEPKVLDLNSVVSNIDRMLRRLIGEDIELVTAQAAGLWPVKADPGQLEQVILNLAVNARDAMPRGGKLKLETANVTVDAASARSRVPLTPGEYVVLSVGDTGSGMSAQVQARLFEPFFTTKEKGRGTGLGLSTVYGIVKQSGGYIWAESELGRGTTFRVYLPRSEAPVDRIEPLAAPSRPTAGSETILLVEDEPEVRRLVEKLLRMQGYTVLVARDPTQALALAADGRHIDLMLTDIVMPGMSGRELARALQPSRPKMRVLYMSGYTEDAISRHGVLDPDTAFLQKPFTPDALARKIREALEAQPEQLKN